MLAYSDLTIEQRRMISASRYWCILYSAVAFVVWSLGLLFITLAMTPPLDNPAGLGLYIIAPLVFALPFGAINAVTTYSGSLKYTGYIFTRSRNMLAVGFVVSCAVALIWYLAIRANTSLWQYSGILWLLWTIVVPSAMIGAFITASSFSCAKDVG